jgi:hypothetical protein
LLNVDKMRTLIRFIAIWAIGSSFIAFTAMKVGAVDMPGTVPPPFPAPGTPGYPVPVPVPAPPKPMPIFPGGTDNAAGGTGNGLGGGPGGGTGGMSGSDIH